MNPTRILLLLLLVISALLIAPSFARAAYAERSCGDCNTMSCDPGSGQYVTCDNFTCRCYDGGGYVKNAYRNCNTDADCATGLKTVAYCRNRVCHVGAPSSEAFCAAPDNCTARFPSTTAYNGSSCPEDWSTYKWNPNVRHYSYVMPTQHIQDCRGIASEPHDRGGVISYCVRCAPSCPDGSTGTACYSGYNSCGMRNAGVLYCSWSLDRKEVDGWQTHWYYTASTACSVGQTPPSESLCGATPIGSFDALTCAAGATGTALDPDAPGSAVPIYIYNADPRPGFGIAPIATVYTNPATQQFSWSLPPTYFDNGSHTLYAFAQDLAAGGGSAGGAPIALANTSRTVTGCVAYPSGAATVTCNAPAQTVVSGTATDGQGSPVSVQVWDTTKGQLMTTISATPGFSINLPAFADGLAHTVSVYAMDFETNTPHLLGAQTCIPPPTAAISSIVDPSYCGGPSMEINWQYSSVGSPMSAFQVKVLGTAFDSGKQPRNGPGAPFSTTGAVRIDPGLLAYDTSYIAELSVWDASDRKSPTVSLAHITLDGPWVNSAFSFDPLQPAAGIPVTFTATITNDPSRSPTDARWDFSNDGTWDANGLMVSHTYSDESGNTTVRMEARNDIMPNGVYCPAPNAAFGVQKRIPGYREVLPGSRPSPSPASGQTNP